MALSEGLTLAERAGIDRATAYDVIAGGAAGLGEADLSAIATYLREHA